MFAEKDWQNWCKAVESCTDCPLKETRTQVVHGVLTKTVKIFLLGEAPGGQEDQSGIPFSGQAGAILNDFLRILKLDREQLYIGNMVKCRPVKVSAKGRYGNFANRAPKQSEIKACARWLPQELQLSGAKVVVTLGNVPLRAMLGKPAKVGDYHGRSFVSEKYGFPVFPLYHPAALIYDRAKEKEYLQDLETLKEWLKEESSCE